MNQAFFIQLNKSLNKPITKPQDDVPVSASEKSAREDIKKLIENAEEIKKLKEQIDSDLVSE